MDKVEDAEADQAAPDPLSRPESDVPPVRHDRPARGLPQQPDAAPSTRTRTTWAPGRSRTPIGQTLHLSLEGIGASLQSEDGYRGRQGDRPRAWPPTRTAGSSPRTRSSASRRRTATEIDFVEKKLSDVVRYIRGPRGTKVRLIVQPADSKERKVYELTRQKIELKEAHAKGQVIETKADGKALKIGVISLPAFYGDTAAVLKGDPDAVSATEDCRKLLKGFKAQGVNAVMVDLRGNGGGLLQEAITLSGLFIDKGPVVQVREASGVKHHDDEEEGTAWDGPLVVLIDRLSASASEIFAGVIKDYGRGLIIGDASTFGKGTVQSIVPINDQLREPRHPQPRRPEADHPAVLPGQRREHPDSRRPARHPHPLARRSERLLRGEDGQRPEVRQGRRRCRTTCTIGSPPTWSLAWRPGRRIGARPIPSSRSATR